MVVFNPGPPPTADPSYLGLSKPVGEFQGDKSYGSLFRGIGDFITPAIKGADFMVKSKISDELYAGIDNERDAYTGALEVGRGQAKNSPTDVLGVADTPDLPEEVAGLSESLGTLQAANKAGKINPTLYHARLSSVARVMRARYPGYRDYIDNKISDITGITPANAYISSLLADINAQGTGTNSQYNKLWAVYKENIGVPGIQQAWEGMEAGEVSPTEFMRKVAEKKTVDTKLALRAALRADEKGQSELTAKDVEEEADGLAYAMIGNYFENIQTSAKIKNPSDITKFAEGILSGDIQADQQQIGQVAQALLGQKMVIRRELWNKFNEKEPGGKSIVQIIGAEAANKKIDSHMTIIDQTARALTEKDPVLANMTTDFIKAQRDDMFGNIMKNKDVAQYVNMMNIIKEAGGSEFSAQFAKDNFQNMNKAVMELTKFNLAEVLTQPDIRKTGIPVTIKDKVEEAQNKDIKNPMAYSKFIDYVTKIADPKTPELIRENLALAAFHPNNKGLLDKFKLEGTADPDTGLPVKVGKYSVFTKMTSRTMTETMKKLGGEHLTNYASWAHEEFGLRLFREEIATLNKYATNPGVRVGWDDNTNELKVEYSAIKAQTTPDRHMDALFGERTQEPIREVEMARNRLNSALRNMKHVGEAIGLDPQSYLVRLMRDSGFRPSKEDTSAGTSFAQAWANALGTKFSKELEEQRKLEEKLTKGE